jgi:broad specificity phosphatase PhoE
MQWIFVRHAETPRNVLGAKTGCFLQNESDRDQVRGVPDHLTPITEFGWSQARQTGLYLKSQYGVIRTVYHSGYLRMDQTAEGILAAHDAEERQQISVGREYRLRERNSGYCFGMLEEEVRRNFPWLQAYWEMAGPVFAQPIGGESILQTAERVEPWLQWLYCYHQGHQVLTLVHGRVLTALRFLLEGWDYSHLEEQLSGDGPRNCGITVYEPIPGQNKPTAELVSYDKVVWSSQCLAATSV